MRFSVQQVLQQVATQRTNISLIAQQRIHLQALSMPVVPIARVVSVLRTRLPENVIHVT